MGHQHLLLLVLGVVLVGLAAVVGIEAFGENQRKNHLEARVHRLVEVAARVQAWGQTPTALGGGATETAIDWPRFRLEQIGIQGEQVNPVNWRWGQPTDPLGCFLLFVNPNPTDDAAGTRVHLHLLDPVCDPDSWSRYPEVRLSGETLDDLRVSYPS